LDTEVYVDEMVAKTKVGNDHVQDLNQIFQQLRRYNMRLNPLKCTFGIKSEKFLGFMLSKRGIKANPDKRRAIIEMHSPTSVKEVQQLTGRIVALSRFMSRVGDKAHPFFQCIKKAKAFKWTEECEEVFKQIKALIACPFYRSLTSQVGWWDGPSSYPNLMCSLKIVKQ
jgi:hypothetical protein